MKGMGGWTATMEDNVLKVPEAIKLWIAVEAVSFSSMCIIIM